MSDPPWADGPIYPEDVGCNEDGSCKMINRTPEQMTVAFAKAIDGLGVVDCRPVIVVNGGGGEGKA